MAATIISFKNSPSRNSTIFDAAQALTKHQIPMGTAIFKSTIPFFTNRKAERKAFKLVANLLQP